MVATSTAIDVRSVVRGQFKLAHEMLAGILADCAGIADTKLPKATITSIAAICAHTLLSEDMMLSGAAATPSLFESGGWSARLGIEGVAGLTSVEENYQFDLATLAELAAAVYLRTDEFLATATDQQLQRQLDNPAGGVSTAIEFLAAFGVVHVSQHAGEIAALKGVHGLKGLPF